VVFDKESIEVMDDIARNRGCIKKGNTIDYEKVSRMILDEFRRGKIGQISLESPRDTVIVEIEEEAYDDRYEEYEAD
jgi:ribosome biogenesis GTPase A